MATKKEIAREVLDTLIKHELKFKHDDALEMQGAIAVVMSRLMPVEEYVSWLQENIQNVEITYTKKEENPKPHLTLVK